MKIAKLKSPGSFSPEIFNRKRYDEDFFNIDFFLKHFSLYCVEISQFHFVKILPEKL